MRLCKRTSRNANAITKGSFDGLNAYREYFAELLSGHITMHANKTHVSASTFTQRQARAHQLTVKSSDLRASVATPSHLSGMFERCDQNTCALCVDSPQIQI